MPLGLRNNPAHTTSQFRAFTAKSLQPARRSGEVGRGPMRDVERRFALPWFIYSLNDVTSSRYQIRGRKFADAADGIFLLSDVEPRYALAHGALQIRRHCPDAARHAIRRQHFLSVSPVRSGHLPDLPTL